MTQAPSQVPAKASPKQDIMSLLQSDHVKKQIALAAPKFMDPERMLRVALTTINRTPALQQCNRQSLLSALMLCTQAGLEPDGRHAHLIPYGDQVQVIFDYKGLIAIAQRNGVKNIRAQAVCENDTFEFSIENGATRVRHVINYLEPRGKEVAYYSVCERDGQCDYEVMTAEEVENIRKRSKAANSGPWVTDPGEMAKKTVLRRHSKRWPMIAELQDAFYADDDRPADRMEPKAPVFEKPIRNSSMDFLDSPAGSLTGAGPVGNEDEKALGDAGLAPKITDLEGLGENITPEHDRLEAWMHANGILYLHLKDLAVREKLYEYADSFESLRDLPVAVVRKLEKMKDGIVAGVKAIK